MTPDAVWWGEQPAPPKQRRVLAGRRPITQPARFDSCYHPQEDLSIPIGRWNYPNRRETRHAQATQRSRPEIRVHSRFNPSGCCRRTRVLRERTSCDGGELHPHPGATISFAHDCKGIAELQFERPYACVPEAASMPRPAVRTAEYSAARNRSFTNWQLSLPPRARTNAHETAL